MQRCTVTGPLFAVLLLSAVLAGCGPTAEPQVASQSNASALTASWHARVTMFGELPGHEVSPYVGRTVASLRQHTRAPEGADFDPDVDPTGKLLVVASTRHAVQPDLYLTQVDGVALTQLTTDPAADVQPAFSPDGRRIAFASNRGGNWNIWMIDVNGGPPVQVTDAPGQEIGPSWSPDGKSLAYCALAEAGEQWSLWTSDAVSGGARRLIGYGLFPQWSPAGDVIVYQRARQRGTRWYSIWTVELVEGEPRHPTEIASSPAHGLVQPAFNADGTAVAYCAVANGEAAPEAAQAAADEAEIWVVGTDGRDRRRVTNGQGTSWSPCWSPDGRLYFARRWNGREDVWSVLPGSAGDEESRWTGSEGPNRAMITASGPRATGK